jgi:hypothetical protein
MDDSFPIDQELIVASRHLPTEKSKDFQRIGGFLMIVACKLRKTANDIISIVHPI